MRSASALLTPAQQRLLDGLQVRLLAPAELPRCNELLQQHHYLGALHPVGERLHYALTDAAGDWLGVLVFCAAARRLRPRDRWIGWAEEQRRRRLSFVVNNTRFLLLPHKTVPNLASKSLRLVLARLSADWQAHYHHPVLLVETFVDPERYSGTLYTASGWTELGLTDGSGRHARDFYVRHDQPKRLFVRELCKNARRSLQAEHLRPALAAQAAKAPPHPTQTAPQLQSLCAHFRTVPDYRARIGSYPLWSLLAIVAAAHLASAPRGQKDLAAFAQRLSQRQRRALGIRPDRTGQYPAPSQPTFCRLYAQVDARVVERALLAFQTQVRGAPPPEELIVFDGKAPHHTGGQQILTAVTVPSQHYLGSVRVADKSNEIPAARDLCERLDLDRRVVSLDALHTQADTARALVLEHGADYLLTVKGNQPTVQANCERHVAPPRWLFPPEATPTLARTVERNKSRAETRTLQSAPITAEAAAFPLAAQAARLRRAVDGRAPETVTLITSLPPEELDAARWLRLNRAHWGIENGLHARLDTSRRDDQCRLTNPNAVWVHGMFARLANSLFMEWRSHQSKPQHRSTTDFATWMAAAHARRVLRTVTTCQPNLRSAS